MSALWKLAAASAWSRRFGLMWVVLSVALSTFLLLGIERVRTDVRQHFSQTVSGTDLIVGARTGSVQLLLYAVFRIGQATQNVRYASVMALQQDPSVAWVVPLSLGDSYQGFAVVGTTTAYFDHFRYGQRQALVLKDGRRFEGLLEAVVGAEVAERLGLRLGQSIVLRHGAGVIESADHADQPFTVVGVLQATGTPVDRSVHVSLPSLEAIHRDWVLGIPRPGKRPSVPEVAPPDLTPQSVTAALVGLHSRSAVFAVQRRIQSSAGEPMMAILPGVALDELWDAVGLAERALQVMGALVAVVSLAGLMSVVITGLEQRRRELAVLRSVGAAPRHVWALLLIEGMGVTALGAVLGLVATTVAMWALSPVAQSLWGWPLSLSPPSAAEWGWVAGVWVSGCLASLVPGWRAYRMSLSDGLSPKM